MNLTYNIIIYYTRAQNSGNNNPPNNSNPTLNLTIPLHNILDISWLLLLKSPGRGVTWSCAQVVIISYHTTSYSDYHETWLPWKLFYYIISYPFLF